MLSLTDLFTLPRRQAGSFSELLPWYALVSPSLVLCQDGSLLAGYTFEGSDIEGRESYVANQAIDQLQQSCKELNDRITLWSIQERRFVNGYQKNEFASPVAAAIDRQWEEELGSYNNARLSQSLYLSFKFPNQSEAFFEELSSEIKQQDGNFLKAIKEMAFRKFSERGAVGKVRSQIGEMADQFEKILASFSSIVEMNLGFRRMAGDDFLGHLYDRANLASDPGTVKVPNATSYLNTYLATDTLVRQGDQFEFKGPTKSTYVAALSTTMTPESASSVQIDELMGANCEYILVQCFRIMDRQVAEKVIMDAEEFYRDSVKSIAARVGEKLTGAESEKINTGNLHLAHDAQQALIELTSEDLTYGYYNMTLLALGNSQRAANDSAKVLASKLRTSGYTVIREEKGLLSAILASFPGGADSILRWYPASVANVADLAPIRTISQGEPTHPFFSKLLGVEVPALARFLTPYGVTYDFNPHETDLGHTAVVGGSGGGKTSLISLLLVQFQKYKPSQSFIFDKDYSMMMMTLMLGGRHLDLSPKVSQRPRMNPVRRMMEANADLRLKGWLEVLIGAGGHTVDSLEGQILYTAIQSLRRSPPANWRLSQLYALVVGEDADLAAKLAPYVDRTDSDDEDVGRGAYANYFDNDDDNFELGQIVGMEVGGILATDAISSPFMDYAFWCIEQRLDGSTPTFIYLEEAWYLFRNPVFAARFEEWLFTFRKLRAFVVFTVLSIDYLANLPNIGSLTVNIPTQILLPSISSSIQQLAPLYREVFGINETQMLLLQQAIPKRDYILVKPSVTRLITTRMPQILIAINEATTRKDLRDQAAKLANSGKENWQMEFIQEVLHVQL